MNKDRNIRMIASLEEIATLVGERQSLNGMETGLGLTLQRDRCLEEVRTITDGLFRGGVQVLDRKKLQQLARGE